MNLRDITALKQPQSKLGKNTLESISEDPASLEESVSILLNQKTLLNKLGKNNNNKQSKPFQYEEEEKEDGSVYIKTGGNNSSSKETRR